MIVQWDQWAATTVPIVVALGGAIYAQWRVRKKEHKENQDKLALIIAERRFLVPHYHQESIAGDSNMGLKVGGIIRAQNGGQR